MIKAFSQETITYTITLENLAIFYNYFYYTVGGAETGFQLYDNPTSLNQYNGGLLLTLKVYEAIYQIREFDKLPRELIDVAPYQYYRVAPAVIGN